MATEFNNPKAQIDPTESVASAQQKLDLLMRRGSPLRVWATSEVTDGVAAWDFVTATPADSALAEVVICDSATLTDLDLPIIATNLGRCISIRNIGGSAIALNADGSDEIMVGGTSAATYSLAAHTSVTLVAADVFSKPPTWYSIG